MINIENLKNEAALIGEAYEKAAYEYFNAENPHPAVVMKKEKLSKAHDAILDAIAYLAAADSADAIHNR